MIKWVASIDFDESDGREGTAVHVTTCVVLCTAYAKQITI